MSKVETPRASRRFPSDSLVQLSSVRLKEFIREPEALFWTFAFPVLLAIGLGIAFRNRPAEVVHIAVVGPSAAASRVAASARADSGLSAHVAFEPANRDDRPRTWVVDIAHRSRAARDATGRFRSCTAGERQDFAWPLSEGFDVASRGRRHPQ